MGGKNSKNSGKAKVEKKAQEIQNYRKSLAVPIVLTAAQRKSLQQFEQMRHVPATNILLQGISCSGKTTIAKTLLYAYNKKFISSKDNIKGYMLYSVLEPLVAMVDQANELTGSTVSRDLQDQICDVFERAASGLLRDDPMTIFSPEDMEVVQTCLEKGFVKQLLKDPKKIKNWNENWAFWLKNWERISTEEYTPTIEDDCMSYYKTIGTPNFKIEYSEKSDLVLNEVGGSLENRKKFKCGKHLYADSKAFVFVVSLADIDLTAAKSDSPSGEELNKAQCSKRVFESFVKGSLMPYLKEAPWFLVLTKRDILLQKIQNGANLSGAFPDYAENDNATTPEEKCTAYTNYIIQTYASLFKKYAGKELNVEQQAFVINATAESEVKEMVQKMLEYLVKHPADISIPHTILQREHNML